MGRSDASRAHVRRHDCGLAARSTIPASLFAPTSGKSVERFWRIPRFRAPQNRENHIAEKAKFVSDFKPVGGRALGLANFLFTEIGKYALGD